MIELIFKQFKIIEIQVVQLVLSAHFVYYLISVDIRTLHYQIDRIIPVMEGFINNCEVRFIIIHPLKDSDRRNVQDFAQDRFQTGKKELNCDNHDNESHELNHDLVSRITQEPDQFSAGKQNDQGKEKRGND